MFADTELARRIEAAEASLIRSCAQAIAGQDASRNTFFCPLAGGVAACVGADSPLTKVAGLGFGGSPEPPELARVEREFSRRGAAVQVELSSLAEGGLAETFTRRGYQLVGFEDVLACRPTRTMSARETELTVRPGATDDLEAWIATLVEAFAAPDEQGIASHESFPRAALARSLADLAGASGLRRYVAMRGGATVGGASLRLQAGLAQLCGAGTLREHRRRGVQSALLDRCLADAAIAGCELAVVTTQPGSKSKENVQRRGFELLYTRAILRLEPRVT